MKKTILASAVTLAVGGVVSVQAQTITITQMSFGGSLFAASGTLNSAGTGAMNSIDNFFANPWVADQQSWFDTHSTTLTWVGAGTSTNNSNAIADFSYTFHLESNQVATGIFFDWNGSNNIPLLTIYDCGQYGSSGCVGTSLPAITAPFGGSQFGFGGPTNDDFHCDDLRGAIDCETGEVVSTNAVPIPAATWLFGSGLLGLIGIARRSAV